MSIIDRIRDTIQGGGAPKPVKWVVMKKIYTDKYPNGKFKGNYRGVATYDHNPEDWEIDTDHGVGQYQIRAYDVEGKIIGQEPLLIGTDMDIVQEADMQLAQVAGGKSEDSGFLGDFSKTLTEMEERADELVKAEEQLVRIKEAFGGEREDGAPPVNGIFDGYSKGLGNAIFSGLQKQDKEVAKEAMQIFKGIGDVVSGIGGNIRPILQIIAHVAGARDINWDAVSKDKSSNKPDEKELKELQKKAKEVLDAVVSEKEKEDSKEKEEKVEKVEEAEKVVEAEGDE